MGSFPVPSFKIPSFKFVLRFITLNRLFKIEFERGELVMSQFMMVSEVLRLNFLAAPAIFYI